MCLWCLCWGPADGSRTTQCVKSDKERMDVDGHRLPQRERMTGCDEMNKRNEVRHQTTWIYVYHGGILHHLTFSDLPRTDIHVISQQ